MDYDKYKTETPSEGEPLSLEEPKECPICGYNNMYESDNGVCKPCQQDEDYATCECGWLGKVSDLIDVFLPPQKGGDECVCPICRGGRIDYL